MRIVPTRYLVLGCTALVLMPLAAAAQSLDSRRTTIYHAPAEQSAMYVQFTPLAGGELLGTFRLAIKKNNDPWVVPGSKIVCVRSRDNGRTWSKEPVMIYQDKDSSAYCECGQGYQAKDGTILVPFYVVTMTGEGRADHIHWNMIAASRDNGRTWYSRPLPSEPFLSNPTYGGFQRARDGSLWLLERCRGYGLDLADLYLRQESWLKIRPCVRIMRSTDEGTTWQIHPSNLTRRVPQGQKDPSGLCPILWYSPVGPSGGTTILAYHDRWGQHARSGGVYLSLSRDEGETWGEPVFLAPGAYPSLHEYAPGEFLCGYYRSNSVLEGAFFQVRQP